MKTSNTSPLWVNVLVGFIGFVAAAFLAHKVLFRKLSPVRVPTQVNVTEPAKRELDFNLQRLPVGTKVFVRVTYSEDQGIERSSNEAWLLAESKGERQKWIINKTETAELSQSPFSPFLHTTNLLGRENIERDLVGDDRSLFPLAKGKLAKFRVEGRSRRKDNQVMEVVCEVGEMNKAKYRIGEYEVFVIRCLDKLARVPTEFKYHYAPALGTNVMVERYKPGRHSFRSELVAFSKP